MQTPKSFRRWLQDAIDTLDSYREVDIPQFVDAASYVREAAQHAARLGLPLAYQRCSSAQTKYWEGLHVLNTAAALAILCACIADIPEPVGTPTPPADGPYTAAQAGQLLGVSQRHVYDLCREGKLACERHGRSIRITREQLEAYRQQAGRQPIKQSGFRHLS